MSEIQNPILTGFNPDPSIVRVGDDYYIATSTFEWFPGVQIHHSKDLVNWELLTHPLNRVSQLDMRGNPNSGGIWAPCLTWDDGTFYLVYTDVKTFSGMFQDTHNYLVTAPDIMGPWSDPVYLNSSGFDPSLFHDDDGRKWVVNMEWGNVSGPRVFNGIPMQEYDPELKKLVGPITNIFDGSPLGITEGPHLYKMRGYYYLITAEGGTDRDHAVTVARSKKLEGPYEIHPENPILCARDNPLLKLQKSGHADIVETLNGEWYMVHLASRPIPTRGMCPLGRETSIQKLEWGKDDWPRLACGGHYPQDAVEAPGLPEFKAAPAPERDDFDSEELNIHFNTLRIPPSDEILSLIERPGYLRLFGRETLASHNVQSLVARRQKSFCSVAETVVEFEPESFQQTAGLVCYYNSANFYYLHLTHDVDAGRCLGIVASQNRNQSQVLKGNLVSVKEGEPVYMKAEVHWDQLQFSWRQEGSGWQKIGPVLDHASLSDDFVEGWGFTGAFVGICCQDLTGRRKYADFDWFSYLNG